MEVNLVRGHVINAAEWDAFVEGSPQGSIYHCHAYLSHLMPGWEAAVVRDGSGILAALPFERKSKYAVEYAIQPLFAQYVGILFAIKTDNVFKNLEFQKKAIGLLHDALPKSLGYFDYYFAPEFTNDQPLHWLGYQSKMRYTYWVDIRDGYAAFLENCASHVRREVKKAEQSGLEVRVENAPEKVISILKAAKPEAVRNISTHFFDALCLNARHYYQGGQSVCLIAYDKEQPIAGIIYFFFKGKMIYYQGSTLPDYKNTGVMTRIITESVRLYCDKHHTLDFDGSMIEPIERFFRGFNAYPVRYPHFTLNRLTGIGRFMLYLKNLVN